MQCCNKELTTPFCPLCGKKSHNAPLLSLLNYVKGHRKAVQNRHNRRVKDKETYNQKRVKASLEKWESWQEVLENLLAEDSHASN